jgi:Flp pilus assembly pilin Flp
MLISSELGCKAQLLTNVLISFTDRMGQKGTIRDLGLTLRFLACRTIERERRTNMLNLHNAFRVFADACLRPLAKREEGVTIVEYAIMLALIAIAVALAAPNVQAAVVAVFGQVITAINSL